MESVRILQDTYEKLFVLTRYLAKLMDEEIQKIGGWKEHCDSILNASKSWQRRKKKEWDNFYELDLYYLLLILGKSWGQLEEFSNNPFFNEDNHKLFVDSKNEFSIWEIRNTVAHPENMGFLEDYYVDSHNEKIIRYRKWDEAIDKAAGQLGFSMGVLLCEIHEKEREDLRNFIFNHSTNRTMESPKYHNLSDKVRKGIEDTKKLIEAQSTAAGIMAFFKDSSFLGNGQYIRKELEENGLPSFDSIEEEIWNRYYGFTL